MSTFPRQQAQNGEVTLWLGAAVGFGRRLGGLIERDALRHQRGARIEVRVGDRCGRQPRECGVDTCSLSISDLFSTAIAFIRARPCFTRGSSPPVK
jgi:hypothetical protein